MQWTLGWALSLVLAVACLLPLDSALAQMPQLPTFNPNLPQLPRSTFGTQPTQPPTQPPPSPGGTPQPAPPTGPAALPPPPGESSATPPGAAAAPATPAAQDDIVREIRIEGTQRIEPATVRSYLTLQLGDKFDPDKMNESLKSLFHTGLFADVTLRRDGNTLVVHVVENPIINRVVFEGNRKVEDKTLMGEIKLKPRTVYTRTRVQADVKRILDVYRHEGRFGATVEPQVILLPENRVDLIFQIHEGDKTRVTRISFIGNHAFDDSRLRSVIQTVEYAWWRFLSENDTYDPDRLNFDRELLRKFYLSNGYADFRVVSAVAELAPSNEGFYITFTLDEGERYRFGKVDVKSAVKEVPVKELASLITFSEGDWYDADKVQATITKMTNRLGDLGYAFVDVRPRVNRDRAKHILGITFDVQQGPRVYIERVNIKGNTRTVDKVIRRELQFAEGDAYSTSKIEESRRRLKNLGYFKAADISNVPGSQPDTTVVNVDVTEQPTGQVSIGAGFSSFEGAIGNFGLNESNFLGRGINLGANFMLSQRTESIDLSYLDPYFMDSNISAGVDLFNTRTDYFSISSFRQRTLGGTVKAGYEILEDLRQTWSYTLRRDDIANVETGASIYIINEAGPKLTSMVSQILVYDKRDNKQDPTSGYFIKGGTDYAGLGGAGVEHYVRGSGSAGYYYPFADQWVGSTTIEGGVMRATMGKQIRLLDKFYLGGDDMHGFQTSGLGPRDAITGDELGGLQYYLATADLSFPIGLPKELGIVGHVFTNIGSLWNVDLSGPNVQDSAAVRVALGLGVGWKSPFGPIRVDFGYPIVKERFDQRELIRFNFGTRF